MQQGLDMAELEYGRNSSSINEESLPANLVNDQPLTTTDTEDAVMVVGGGGGGDDDASAALTQEARVLPSVGAFTVQCARCMKWRLIPTKERYEEIRESVLEQPFFCSTAASWRPNASCDEPSDVSQDEDHLWAIDRPNIPVAPQGWERLLVIRAAGASKFADVYYVSPSGRKLRSMPEVERFLAEHPEYTASGLKLSQFSFIIPRPLDKNYCRKKTTGSPPSDGKGTVIQKHPSSSKIKKSHVKKLGATRKPLKAKPENAKDTIFGIGSEERFTGDHNKECLASEGETNPCTESVDRTNSDYFVQQDSPDTSDTAGGNSDECFEATSVEEQNLSMDLSLVQPTS